MENTKFKNILWRIFRNKKNDISGITPPNSIAVFNKFTSICEILNKKEIEILKLKQKLFVSKFAKHYYKVKNMEDESIKKSIRYAEIESQSLLEFELLDPDFKDPYEIEKDDDDFEYDDDYEDYFDYDE